MFYDKIKGRYGKASECILCFRDRSKKIRKHSKEHIKQKSKEWREKNKGYNKRYYYNNLEYNRNRALVYSQRVRETLHDTYILTQLKLKRGEETQELIELKRAQLKLYRATK